MTQTLIDRFSSEAEAELEKRNSDYNDIKVKLIEDIKEICSSYNGVSVIGRLKDFKKIREKIYRKNYYTKYQGKAMEFIDGLPDAIGIRIVCSLNSDEEKIVKSINKAISSGKYNFTISTEDQPQTQKNGLAIYRMDGVYNKEGQKVRFELQVKSQTHNLWGEVEHALFYKNYDFIIGGDIFNGFMKNIYKELEIIDDELTALNRYLKKNDDDRYGELREIATRIIEERFEKEIESIVGCSIDLREVYVLLAEISIKFDMTNDDEIIQQIQELTIKLKNAKDVSSEDFIKSDEKVDEDSIASRNLDIARLIDKNIKAGDIYWFFFFDIFLKLFKPSTYSKGLGDLANELMDLYKGLSDDVVLLNEEEEDVDLNRIINKAIIAAATDVNKISFFSTRYCMKGIKSCVKDALLMFEELFDKHPAARVDDNEESIVVFLYISIMLCLKEKIKLTRMMQYDFSTIHNDYQLTFSKENIEVIRKQLLEFTQIEELIQCFSEED